MPSGLGSLRTEAKGRVDVETHMVVSPSCYHNGNLEDLREKYAIRTIPTRKEGFTRAILALYHLAIFVRTILLQEGSRAHSSLSPRGGKDCPRGCIIRE